MPSIVTPGQLTQRSQFYQQLAQLTAAGITIVAALEMLVRNPPSRTFREPIRRVLTELQHGATVSDAWPQLGKWVPTFDVALIQAAEKSGRLDSVFRMLADYYFARAAMLRRIITDLLYPVFLFHFAVVLFPFITWFAGSMSVQGFALRIFGVLIPVYAIVFLVIYASQGQRGSKWRSTFERLTRPIPVLGTGRHYLALARLAASLEALINAGVNIIEAWEMAADASGSPGIERAVENWRPELESGKTPAEAVNDAPRQFPEVFANLYHSGEVSGELDGSLRRISNYYQELGSEKIHLVSKWFPMMIYFGVAGMVAYKVIAFYTDYFNQIKQAGGF